LNERLARAGERLARLEITGETVAEILGGAGTGKPAAEQEVQPAAVAEAASVGSPVTGRAAVLRLVRVPGSGRIWVSVGRRGANRFGAGQAAAAGGPRAATATRSRRIVAALAFANGRLAWTMSPGLRSDRRYVSLAVTGQGTALASRFE
jgi:hypothetical protein